MKTKQMLCILWFNLGFIFLASAQTVYQPSKAGDNWFIHLGVGGQLLLDDKDDDLDIKNPITLAPTLSAGKWLSPSWGVRVKGQGGSLRKFDYYNVQLDALWNLANICTPYLGIGLAHRLEEDNAFSVNGGLQFGFHLSKRLSLDFDLGASAIPDYDAVISATGGLTLHLGKVTFDPVEPMNSALISELNGKINKLREENERLTNRKIDCPQCPPAAPIVASTAIEHVYVPNVVFFRLNSSQVDDNQQISIYNTTEYIQETGKKLKVIGYADKGTGSDTYNLKLSQKRAKAVVNELITKYHVSPENIVVEWKGAEEQPYKENQWNRVVVMIPQ